MAHIIVDPISTGANLAHDLLEENEKVIAVWSTSISESLRKLIIPGLRTDYIPILAKSDDHAGADDIIEQLREKGLTEIRSVVAGTESGLYLSDLLSSHLGIRTNGYNLSACRRDKYLMGEKIRESGIRAVLQRKCKTLEEGLEFARSHPDMVLVLKPTLSAGSEDVYKIPAGNEELFIEKFNTILGKINRLGVSNDCVLVQEFLYGSEYVVDTVSLDGVHKLAGCWRYIKAQVNGADFVYYGMEIVDGKSEEARVLFEYISKVLEALEIKHYAGHAEVMLDPIKGPCLVEIGARPHGAEGIFVKVAEACCGCSQVSLLKTAMAHPEQFKSLPEGRFSWDVKNGYGAVKDLVCFVEGVVDRLNPIALKHFKELKPFAGFHCLPEPGQKVTHTIDCFTTIGSISLWAETPEEVFDALEKIKDIEKYLVVVQGTTVKQLMIDCKYQHYQNIEEIDFNELEQ